MDVQTIGILVFILLMAIFLYSQRKSITVQKIAYPLFYLIMLKSKFGLKFMDGFSKRYSKPLKYIGYAAVFFGFLGMALICYTLLSNIYMLLTKPAAAPSVGLVLPFKMKGAFFVPFFYWIISIFVIAVVHEFSHGIIARKYGMKIKSSGLAFLAVLLPVIPAAFVEPDEKELKKRPHKEQLSVFAAGPFSNIILAFIILGIAFFVFAPIANSIVEFKGVEVTGIVKGGYPAEKAGLADGEVIKEVNGIAIDSTANFSSIMGGKKPGDTIVIKTDKGSYDITLGEDPENKGVAYLGVKIQQKQDIKGSITEKYGSVIPSFFLWIGGLIYWLFILNLGIGLFNLVPIGPIDGGRMLQLICHKMFDKEKGDRVWKRISLFFLLLVFVNLAFAFVK